MSKGQRSNHWENVKNRFRPYVRQKWIDLRQTKIKIINSPHIQGGPN